MERFMFEGYGSRMLHGRYWRASSPSATLLIIHGFGEHSGRYTAMAEHMTGQAISVAAYDLRGHGLSEGTRGHVLDWIEYREDARAAAAEALRRHPDLPLFILGHSVGGTVALEAILEGAASPAGVIISAPTLGAPGISPVLLTLARLLSVVTPGLLLSTGLDTNALSRIPQVCREYREDPLVHDKACVRLSTELRAAQRRIFGRAAEMDTPLLLAHGSADKIAPQEPVEEFHRCAGSEDKELRIFEDAFHEIHNDIVADEVHRLYSDWIRARA